MSRSLNNVYILMKALLNRAATTGETGASSLNIPYFEIKEDITAEDFEFSDLDLKVSISLEWVESDFFQHIKDEEDSDEQ